MIDALGRHAYAVDAGWAGARARPDWHAAYAYDRWRPTLFASYSDDTDPSQRRHGAQPRDLRGRAVDPFRHVRVDRHAARRLRRADRHAHAATTVAAAARTRAATCARSAAGWLHDSRRQFGYSISAEEGFAVEAAAETSRTALGSDADAGAAMIDVRALSARRSAVTPCSPARLAGGRVLGRHVGRGASSPPRVPGRRIRSSTSAATRSVCCAASSPEDVIGTRAVGREPRPALPARASAARRRHVAALPALAPWRRVRRCRPRVGHRRSDAADIRTSIGAELSRGSRHPPLRAADASSAAPPGRAIPSPIARRAACVRADRLRVLGHGLRRPRIHGSHRSGDGLHRSDPCRR